MAIKRFWQTSLRKKKIKPLLSKRQKFVFGVCFLSVGLFISQYLFTSYIFLIAFCLAIITDIIIFFSIREDLKENFSLHLFILPLFYSFAFGLFYFLVPSRFLSRAVLTTFYAIGLYSLFLSENIFTVAASRTITLLNGARIVTLIITLVSYFFLANIIFSLHGNIFLTVFLVSILSVALLLHAIWTYTLDAKMANTIHFVLPLTLCLSEMATILWFWPTSPTVLALFLTGLLYILIGVSHVWLDKRLFKSIIWEYVWIAIFSFFILILFTHWRG